MAGPDLTDEELERYQRHIILRHVGGPGQKRLRAARVLVIGAGGLGSPVILYLAAAGIGTIGVIDDDRVSLSNLQRQIIHRTADAGTAKVESAGHAVAALNPNVTLVAHDFRLTAQNALSIIGQYDIVADGSDTLATRYLVNDACYFARVPLVAAAVGQYDGQVTTFRAFETGEAGAPKPNYRCLMPEPPPDGLLPTCEEAGILGALTGIIGSIQALEVMKEILGIGDSLAGRLLIYDALSARFQIIALPWREDCPLTGTTPTITDLSVHARGMKPESG